MLSTSPPVGRFWRGRDSEAPPLLSPYVNVTGLPGLRPAHASSHCSRARGSLVPVQLFRAGLELPRALAVGPVLPRDPAPSRAPHQTRCSRRVTLAGHPPVGLRTHSLDGGVRGISARAPDAFRVSRRRPFPFLVAVESKRGLATCVFHACVAPQRSVVCRASAIMRHAAPAELRRLASRRIRPFRASMMTRSEGWQPPRVLVECGRLRPRCKHLEHSV